jgi:hypothetical protein
MSRVLLATMALVEGSADRTLAPNQHGRSGMWWVLAAAAAAVAALSGCGGAESPDAGESARTEAAQAINNPAAASIVGIMGHGTALRPDGGFLAARTQTSFPINNGGVVAINTNYSSYPDSDPDPGTGPGFLLTSDGVSYQTVVAAADRQADGNAIDDSGNLTYQRGPIGTGTPPQFQFARQAAPYDQIVDYSSPSAEYAFDLDVNAAGQGAAQLTPTDFPVRRLVRFDGQGGVQELEADPNYVLPTLSTPRILSDGTVYVAVLNYGIQAYEIWRYEPAVHTPTVAYSKPATEGAILTWDVSATGTLVIGETDAGGSPSRLRTVSPDGTQVIVAGTTDAECQYNVRSLINASGLVAAFRTCPGVNQSVSELLYAPPGGEAVRVLGTGDQLNGRAVLSLASTSEMNELGQLTFYAQLDRPPEGGSLTQLVAIASPLFPTIASFSPTSGQVGASVTITGRNFSGATSVTFNGVAAAFTVVSPTQITATVPVGATSGLIGIVTAAGAVTSVSTFVVTTAALPRIDSFSPAAGFVGQNVNVQGANLSNSNVLEVRFNGVPATSIFRARPDGTAVTAVVPAGASTGPITVTTAAGTAQSATDFVVIPPPTIASFSPASGPVGSIVTVEGSGFDRVASSRAEVSFSGANGRFITAQFTVVSANVLTATVPRRAVTGPIRISGRAVGIVLSEQSFVVTP